MTAVTAPPRPRLHSRAALAEEQIDTAEFARHSLASMLPDDAPRHAEVERLLSDRT